MSRCICILNDSRGEAKGVVKMTQHGSDGVHFDVSFWNLLPGKYGFHVHRSGNLSQGAHSLCDHYSSPGKRHGDLNDPNGHNGDLGNLTVGVDGRCKDKFVARYVSLIGDVRQTIIGRSLVVHTQKDDLGLGQHSDSKTTGHSGERMLYGIIGIDEDCTSARRAEETSDACSIF